MGKHSNTVFSINRNTAGSDESLLLDCLSSNTVRESKIYKNQTLPDDDITNEEMAHVESDFGTLDIPNSCIELLKEFEKEVSNFSHFLWYYM